MSDSEYKKAMLIALSYPQYSVEQMNGLMWAYSLHIGKAWRVGLEADGRYLPTKREVELV